MATLVRKILWLICALSLPLASTAFATSPLPYTLRTQDYSGFFTTVHGDIRTVGMSGATVGLGDTFIASLDNPAGLAMTVGVGDDNFSSDTIHDNAVQGSDAAIGMNSIGFALGFYPWTLSIGYISPYREDASYFTAAAPTDPAEIDVTTRELHLAAARMFLHDRLAVGFGLMLGQAEEAMQYATNTQLNVASHTYAAGFTLGAMWRLYHRVLFGMSYTTPVTYGAGTDAAPGLPGFFEPVDVPWRVALGLGWIPNRFFRTDLSLFAVGPTPSAALLKDDSIAAGQSATLQPRIGAAYTLVDYKELTATLFVGTYYEWTRIAGASSRIHGTGGVEFKPWIFTLGWAFDSSAGYSNYLVSFSVDVFKTLAKLDLIPTAYEPKRAGILPDPAQIFDDGLPRTLVDNWVQRGPDINPLDVAKQLPNKIQQKVQETGQQIQQILGKEPTPTPTKTRSRPRARPTPKSALKTGVGEEE